MGLIIGVMVVTLIVIAGALVMIVRDRRADAWDLGRMADGRWQLCNRTGHRALEVYVRIEGARVRLVGHEDIGDVDRGEAFEIRTSLDPAGTGFGPPMIRVTWARHADGGREAWRARFDP